MTKEEILKKHVADLWSFLPDKHKEGLKSAMDEYHQQELKPASILLEKAFVEVKGGLESEIWSYLTKTTLKPTI